MSAVEKLDCEDDDAVGDGILLVLVPVEASAAPNQAAGLVGQNCGRWAHSAGLWVGSAMTSLGSRKGLVLGGGDGVRYEETERLSRSSSSVAELYTVPYDDILKAVV